MSAMAKQTDNGKSGKRKRERERVQRYKFPVCSSTRGRQPGEGERKRKREISNVDDVRTVCLVRQSAAIAASYCTWQDQASHQLKVVVQ